MLGEIDGTHAAFAKLSHEQTDGFGLVSVLRFFGDLMSHGAAIDQHARRLRGLTT